MSKKQKLDLTDFLTSPLRDEETTSIVTNLFNRFLSEEQSVRINGQIGLPSLPNVADIPPTDLDRELNALVPALYYKTGVEERLFTFDDLTERLSAIGADTNNLREMLAEKNFNFIPPISLDKFVNYSSYFWAPTMLDRPSWNLELDPEYYVMARPNDTSIFKMPAKVATTRDVRLWGKDRRPETITIEFTSSSEFTVVGDQGILLTRTSDVPGEETSGVQELPWPNAGGISTVRVFAPNFASPDSGGYGVDDDALNDMLFTCSITVGDQEFEAGDTFTINITYVTGTNSVAFDSVNAVDKGFLSNITPDVRIMKIDGLQMFIGDSVLVRSQTNSAENGLYTIQAGKWQRLLGATSKEQLPQNSVVYITNGETQASHTFALTRASDTTFVLDDPVLGQQSWVLSTTNSPSYLNDWQVFNCWVHVDDLQTLPLVVSQSAVQAKRPIIEYSFGMQLNRFVNSAGYPADAGSLHEQRKSTMNQIPQFDLFRYDGTPAFLASPIFFYAEDPDFPIDKELQKRVKTNSNPDFVFSLGINDSLGQLLFWKRNSALETIWEPDRTS